MRGTAGKKKIHRDNIGQANAASARGSGSREKQKVFCTLGDGGPERGSGKDMGGLASRYERAFTTGSSCALCVPNRVVTGSTWYLG